MVERRKYRRLDVSIPLSIKLSGATTSPPAINVETDNISLDGLAILIKIKIQVKDRWLSIPDVEDSIKLLQYLLMKDKTLELGINVLPKGKSIPGIGKVMWYDRALSGGFYYLRAGIFIEEMDGEYKEKWLEFLRAAYQMLFRLRLGRGSKEERSN